MLLVEFVLAAALPELGAVHRPALDRAFFEWRQHQTTEMLEEFERQKRIGEVERWGVSGGLFAVLAGVTIFLFPGRKGEQGSAADGS